MLLLAALPVGAASADEFTDSADITHVEAVRMLTDLGLLSGYSDGSFRPDVPVTRAQIAKLIALLSTESPAASGAADFADVAEEGQLGAFLHRLLRRTGHRLRQRRAVPPRRPGHGAGAV